MFDKLTKSDIEKMEKEIEYRKVTLRKELLEDVKEARSHGDLSENFEYYAAKKEKNKNGVWKTRNGNFFYVERCALNEYHLINPCCRSPSLQTAFIVCP